MSAENPVVVPITGACLALCVSLLVPFATGCASAPASGPPPPEQEARPAEAGAAEKSGEDAVAAVRVNRTLIYRVRHQRAEDLAETLRPLFEARYGPSVRIVAHPESNRLLITIPPRSERANAGPLPRGR